MIRRRASARHRSSGRAGRSISPGRDQADSSPPSLRRHSACARRSREVGAAGAIGLVPALRADYVPHAFLDPTAADLEVGAILEAYLRRLRQRGGKLLTDAEVTGLARAGTDWEVATRVGRLRAPVLVNAAGAWADPWPSLPGSHPWASRPCAAPPSSSTLRTVSTPATGPWSPTCSRPSTSSPMPAASCARPPTRRPRPRGRPGRGAGCGHLRRAGRRGHGAEHPPHPPPLGGPAQLRPRPHPRPRPRPARPRASSGLPARAATES